MFLRLFKYRVQPQLRDRHLALQQRAVELYRRYVARSPQYFRRGNDPNVWVEIHWYPDRQSCRRVAESVARDAELTRMWREFQETLDPAFPVILEEFDEYELPVAPDAPPMAKPPIDAASPLATAPAAMESPQEPDGDRQVEIPAPSFRETAPAPAEPRPVETQPFDSLRGTSLPPELLSADEHDFQRVLDDTWRTASTDDPPRAPRDTAIPPRLDD